MSEKKVDGIEAAQNGKLNSLEVDARLGKVGIFADLISQMIQAVLALFFSQ